MDMVQQEIADEGFSKKNLSYDEFVSGYNESQNGVVPVGMKMLFNVVLVLLLVASFFTYRYFVENSGLPAIVVAGQLFFILYWKHQGDEANLELFCAVPFIGVVYWYFKSDFINEPRGLMKYLR